jgi:hypothetical protein
MQSRILAETFSIVHVSPEELLKAEAEKNPGVKLKIRGSVESETRFQTKLCCALLTLV